MKRNRKKHNLIMAIVAMTLAMGGYALYATTQPCNMQWQGTWYTWTCNEGTICCIWESGGTIGKSCCTPEQTCISGSGCRDD
jgi:hypothetical protein